MQKHAGFMKALKCRECGREYPLTANHVCDFDFGPLEVVYDYERIKLTLTRAAIQSRPKSMWRFRELLPIAGEPTVGLEVGCTPLIKADRLARRLGIRELWVKNDTVNYPTLSFKDRVVSVALSRAGNWVLPRWPALRPAIWPIPSPPMPPPPASKPTSLSRPTWSTAKSINSLIYGGNVIGIKGHYDEVNRLCAEIAGKYPWAFVNVNMRPYYAEGSKSMGFEIIEQSGWRVPPPYRRLHGLRLFADQNSQELPGSHQAGPGAGTQYRHPRRPSHRLLADFHRPKSRLGFLQTRQAQYHRQIAGHWHPRRWLLRLESDEGNQRLGEDVTDDEIREGIKLLAECEGIFAETAGGVTVGVARKLIASGAIPADDSAVLCITGNGLEDARGHGRPCRPHARDQAEPAGI